MNGKIAVNDPGDYDDRDNEADNCDDLIIYIKYIFIKHILIMVDVN